MTLMRAPSLIARLCVSLLTASLAFCAAVSAQDPQKIIDQYLKAQGGRKALSKIQTETLQGTFPDGDAAPGTFTLYLKSPNRYYPELILNNQPQIAAYNEKSAWHQEPTAEPATLLADAG